MTIRKKRWTEAEIQIVRELSQRNFSSKEIAKRINRSESAVQDAKTKFNIRTQEFEDFIWKNEDTLKLIELRRQGYSDSKLAKIFGRSLAAIKAKLHRDKIKSPRQTRIWTDEEKKLLKEMVGDGFSKREIARKLKKSIHAIRTRVIILKIRSKNAPLKWTPEEFQLFKEYLEQGLKIEEISLKMNRGVCGLISKAKQQHLRKKYPQVNEFLRNYEYCQNESLTPSFTRKIQQIKNSAKSRGLEFDLSGKYLEQIWNKQNGECYYSGEEMTYISGYPNTFSVDRIDSEKGYIEGNIVLCLSHINTFKGDMSKKEFLRLCKMVSIHNNLI